MTDFALLYSGGSMPESEEEQAKVMKAWTDWYGTIGSSLKDGGNPFAQAKTVGSRRIDHGRSEGLAAHRLHDRHRGVARCRDGPREGLAGPRGWRHRHRLRDRGDVSHA